MKKIPLSRGLFALVDDEDFEWLSEFKWYACFGSRGGQKVYAVRWARMHGRRVKIRMHREILGLLPFELDRRIGHHKDDDGLNNQRENLEVLESNLENMLRTPGWRKRREPFL